MLLLFASMTSWANNDSLSVAERNAQLGFNDTINRFADDFIEASVLLADQGYELFSIFGHMALRLKCQYFGMDYVFTYEGERIDDRLWSFIKGDLKMGVFAIPAHEYIDEFESAKKGLVEYKLKLTPEQEMRLWEKVEREMMSKKEIKYDLFTHGCAASIRDWITEVVRPEEIVYQQPMCTHGKLISDIFFNHTAPDWAQFPIATIGGGPLVFGNTLTDLQRLVAPRDLVYEWQRATVQGEPLLAKEGVRIAQYEPIKKTWFSPLVFSLLILLLCIANLFISQTYWDWIMLVGYTALGCVVVFTHFFQPMSVIGWSWLAIPFNPLPAVFWHWRDKWAIPFAALIALWCVVILVIPHRITTYAHIILAISFALVCIKTKIVLVKA